MIAIALCAAGCGDEAEPRARCTDGTLAAGLSERCAAKRLAVDPSGRVACQAFHVCDADSSACGCSAAGLMPVTQPPAWLREQLEQRYGCGALDELRICELLQHSGAELDRCQNDPQSPTTMPTGFCYVDPAQGAGSEVVVEMCPADARRLLRITGAQVNWDIFLSCQG